MMAGETGEGTTRGCDDGSDRPPAGDAANSPLAFHAEGASTPPAGRARRGAPAAVMLVVGGTAAATALVLVDALWEVAIAVTLLGPLAVWLLARGRLADLGLRHPGRGLAMAATGGAMVLCVTGGAVTLLAAVGFVEFGTAGLSPDERLGQLAGALVAGLLIAGIGEELCYRGALLRLVAAWRGAPLAVAACGGLFGLAHLPTLVDQDLATTDVGTRLAILAILGCAWAIATWRTGSLWLAIGWHGGGSLLGEAARAYVIVEPVAPVRLVGGGDALSRSGVLGVGVAVLEAALLIAVANWLARAHTRRRQMSPADTC